jgi:hypothetical protein
MIISLRDRIFKFPIHTFLFSLFPLMFFFQMNIHELLLEDVIFPLFLSISITFVFWIILQRFIGSKRSGLIVSLLIMCLVNLGNISLFISENPNESITSSLEQQVLVIVLLIISVLGIIYFIRTKTLDDKTSIANVISITMIGFLIFNISTFAVMTSDDESSLEFSNVPIQISNVENKPDIYFIILDEYAGFLQLENDFDYNNDEFRIELEKRKFSVVENSFSNYPNTSLSMPSIMNMIYFDFIPEHLGKDSKNINVVQNMINKNNVMKILKANNYKIITLDGAIGRTATTTLADERLCANIFDINPDIRKNFALVYVPITGLRDLVFEEVIRDKLECSFETLTNFQNIEDPNFVVAHLRIPHSPYIYDSTGNSVSVSDIGDKSAYLEQLKFVNKKIIKIIDRIQERSSDTVIILISDHGYRHYIDWNDPTPEDYIRGFNNLMAVSLPNENEIEINGPVNIFRSIFNSSFNMDYKILDNRQIWYSPDKPFDHNDVTNIIQDYEKTLYN